MATTSGSSTRSGKIRSARRKRVVDQLDGAPSRPVSQGDIQRGLSHHLGTAADPLRAGEAGGVRGVLELVAGQQRMGRVEGEPHDTDKGRQSHGHPYQGYPAVSPEGASPLSGIDRTNGGHRPQESLAGEHAIVPPLGCG